MRKLYKGLSIATPIVVVGGSIATYFAVSMKKGNEINEDTQNVNSTESIPKHSSAYDKFNVFPDVTQDQFYEYIRIKGSRPVITDEFISAFISYVIKNANIAGGSLNWNYRFNDGDLRQHAEITFRWLPPNILLSTKVKTYQIDLSQDNI